jgi:hypothetical protein
MDTLADGTEAGGKPAAMVREMAARHARETRTKFWRVFVVSSFFVIVLGANLFVGAVVVFGNIRAQSTAANDAATGKTARVTRPLLDGTFCRYTVFDSNTSNTLEDRVERCDAPRGKPKIRARSEFTWGGTK